MRQAISGISAHSANTGNAAGKADGFQRMTQAPMARASSGEPHTDSSSGPVRVAPSRLVRLEGFHSSSRRRDTVSRYSVRKMASRL
ncbi:hypothetical protein D3C71_1287060 [compost metagenome]